MLNKKMSIVLASRSKIKTQLDELLNADYQLLNQKEDIPNNILNCQIVKQNTLIQEYIEEVQSQYNIQSPLKCKHLKSSSKTSSYKKINISLRSSKVLQQTPVVKQKNKKRLTLTSKMNNSLEKSQTFNAPNNASIKTPKFGLLQGKQDIMMPPEGRVNLDGIKSSRLLNHLDSKEKPITTQSNYRISSTSNIQPVSITAKKKSQLDLQQQEESILTYRQLGGQKTAKKNYRKEQSEEQNMKAQSRETIMHRNPITDKIQSRTKIEIPKIAKAKQSYRYCVGCEQAILQYNIKAHQRQCTLFIELSNLTNKDLYLKLKEKIRKIEEMIPQTQFQLHPDSVQHLRSRSANLVKESRNRKQRSPQTQVFRQNYQGVMQMGRKWSYAVEEINKLRWFTRIVEKLENMLKYS